jgi:fumarate reductase subunit D
MAKATGETIWWSLFAAGGVVAALLVPALIFITGIALPFLSAGAFENVAPPSYGTLNSLAFSLLGKLVLCVTISLSLIHCAHRLVHTSKDLGLHAAHALIAFLFYGGAIVGTVFTVWVLWL